MATLHKFELNIDGKKHGLCKVCQRVRVVNGFCEYCKTNYVMLDAIKKMESANPKGEQ